MSIWTKLILKDTLKVFVFFILGLYFIYSLIDYSSRIEYYSHIPIHSVLFHYVCLLSQKMELLLPFAFMVTLIKVLTSMNTHNELVSMLMAGRSYKQLLKPLFIFAGCLSLTLYLNFQFLEPVAQEKIQGIKQKYSRSKKLTSRVKSYVLDDGSKLVFSDYDAESKTLKRVYWLKSPDHIYYAKTLYPYSAPPTGHFVTHFSKQDEKISLEDKWDLYPFQEMKMEFNPALLSKFSVRTYSITHLVEDLKNTQKLLNIDKAELITLLNYKLILPLLPIFILIALAPICTQFSRNVRSFLIYMSAIIVLLSFFTSVDACYILSENRVIYPQIALWIPLLLFFSYPVKRFFRY